jgi:flagellar biosynthetic protein FlhB
MADEAGDKTEQASQQKLRKVREQGQVVRSRDVATAIGLMVGLKLTLLLMPLWLADFEALFRLILSPMDGPAGLLNLGSLVFPAVMLLLVKMVPRWRHPAGHRRGFAVAGRLDLQPDQPAAQAGALQPAPTWAGSSPASTSASSACRCSRSACCWRCSGTWCSSVTESLHLQSLTLGQAIATAPA